MSGYAYFFSMIGLFVLFWAVLIIPLFWMTWRYTRDKK